MLTLQRVNAMALLLSPIRHEDGSPAKRRRVLDWLEDIAMSARPRPVTATVNPPLTSTPLHGPRTFLSSDGSTESLISVLEHDSYQSLPPSDNEQDKPVKKVEEKPQQKIQRKTASKSSETLSKSEDRTEPSADSSSNGRHTPWEDWMVRKAKEIRIREEMEARRLKRLKQEKEKEEKERAEKAKKCEKNVQEWNERKVIELKTRKKMTNQCINAEKELKEAKKNEIEEKAKTKFEEWQKQKFEEEKERKRQEKLKKENEEREKEERKQKCDEKYKAWLKEAKCRPKSAPHSYGYAEGKLTGYYDRCTYPKPSFYNPIPWQPIPVPNQVSAKKNIPKPKKTVRKRFNPSKYL